MTSKWIWCLVFVPAACGPQTADLGASGVSAVGDPKNGSATAVEPNACLLEYGAGVASGEEDPCCYHVGRENHCRPEQWCDDPTGASCCVVYATAWAPTGPVCCKYADGTPPVSSTGEDLSGPCQALLASSSAEGTCLLRYGSPSGESGDCCYRTGDVNRCHVTEPPAADGCVVAATPESPSGAGCCAYADGRAPSAADGRDITATCQAMLLAEPEPSKACRLEYNPLLDAPNDGCCAWPGQASQCRLDVPCGKDAGDDCCIIHATADAPTGPGCCYYADGRPPRSASGVNIALACELMLE